MYIFPLFTWPSMDFLLATYLSRFAHLVIEWPLVLLSSPYGAPSLLKTFFYALLQGCRQRGGALAPQFLAKQLTLSQPGGQNMPTSVLLAPTDFQTLRRACILLVLFLDIIDVFINISQQCMYNFQGYIPGILQEKIDSFICIHYPNCIRSQKCSQKVPNDIRKASKMVPKGC